MSQAQCLCGAVRWEFRTPVEWMWHCHCSRCRKAHGSGFATFVFGAADGFHGTGGESVVRYESAPGLRRSFCRHCGSVVAGEPSEGRVYAPAGNFLDDPGVRPVIHIFAGSKAPWVDLADGLPSFETHPEGIDGHVLPDRPPLDPPGGVRGSCLCGAVSFVVESDGLRCWNCHCGRCQRARSAAHATNLFTAVDGLRFTRGQDLVDSYKVPDAVRFTQAFCRTCGSSMPRHDRERGLAIVPMGSLDDDPGIRPERHIYTGSKAPWYTIPDSLPRHDEYPVNV